MIEEAIARVSKMELYFDILQMVLESNPKVLSEDALIKTMLHILMQYYDGGQWMRDYTLDEQGLLPKDLKRGILTEDTLYNFFDSIRQIEECK